MQLGNPRCPRHIRSSWHAILVRFILTSSRLRCDGSMHKSRWPQIVTHLSSDPHSWARLSSTNFSHRTSCLRFTLKRWVFIKTLTVWDNSHDRQAPEGTSDMKPESSREKFRANPIGQRLCHNVSKMMRYMCVMQREQTDTETGTDRHTDRLRESPT